MRQILDSKKVSQTIGRLAEAIALDCKWSKTREIAMIGIHRRGVYLARRIASLLEEKPGCEVKVGTLDITFHRDDLGRTIMQPLVGVTEIPFSIDGSTIYLVDDVLYTGRTIRAAIDAILEFGRPTRIRLVALVDRGHRQLPIQADFAGHRVKTKESENVRVLVKELDGKDEVIREKGKID